MRNALLAFLVSAACVATQSAAAAPLMFDMGSQTSELRPGFVRITPESAYAKEVGYGWKSTHDLKAHYQPYSREWTRNENSGTMQPPPTYANEITCDAIGSDRPGTFLVDVPPGEYTIYLLCGLSAGSEQDYHWFDVVVGQDRTTVKIPGPYHFENRTLHAKVADEPLAVEFVPTTDWMVSCLVIFPTSEGQSVRAEILDPLEEEVYFLPPDVAKLWKETKHVDPRPMPEFGAADHRRGYAIFARHWSEVIYPNTVPRSCELYPELQMFASPGEYEPATFTVLPLKDLSSAVVVASDLRCGEAVIAARDIDIRTVRYMRVRPDYATFNSYHVVPDVLEHRQPVNLRQRCNQTYWITVKVADDALPGVYEGKLTFAPAAGPAAEVPLKLRVLPIRLRTNPEHIYGMYYNDPLAMMSGQKPSLANDYFQRKAEMERRDMAEHGMNTHVSGVVGVERNERHHWTINAKETERRIALDRRFGLADKPLVVSFGVEYWYTRLVDAKGLGSHAPPPSAEALQSFFGEVTKMVEVIERERKWHGWPEFLYYPVDEPSTEDKSVRFMVGVLKAIKQVPGVRTYVTADPTVDQFEPLWPYVDVWCCDSFVFDYEKIRQLSREKHIEFWCYPNHVCGTNDHTPVRGARMTWGFGFWRSGFKALAPWIYQANVGDPWNYLDGPTMDFFNRSTADGEPVPLALWEAYRAGIDDGRYVYTLEQLVAKGRQKGGRAATAAAEAEKELKRVWDAIEVQNRYVHEGLWSGADFDAYRWLLASQILELQETLK